MEKVINNQDYKFEFAIDRGGTFTDVFCLVYPPGAPESPLIDTLKLLSEDPQNYSDAISEGIRQVINNHIEQKIERGTKIPTRYIKGLRIGTTLGTNALLEKKGAKTALIVTRGFKDLMRIGNQSRPDIFALDINRGDILYSKVLEVDERVYVKSTQEEATGEHEVAQKMDVDAIRRDVKQLREEGFESLAISFMHAYCFDEHEKAVEAIAAEEGFDFISTSHKINNNFGYLARTSTTLLDAYLTPVLKKYLNRLLGNFEDENFPIFFMQSDGAIVPAEEFSGYKSILSGPAGGITGYAKTTISQNFGKSGVIGFDMGGTSTDVSIFNGEFDLNYEAEIAGTFISTPHLDINTVAAGGGSRLFYRNSMFEVGPESAGSHPGPVCYGKDGYVAVTDANLQMGRIVPEFFPKIFGKNQDSALFQKESESEFEVLVGEIEENQNIEISNGVTKVQQCSYGYLKVANEVMCRPVRALTESRGQDPKKFELAVFGGAGAQHACSIASNLNISKIFVHKYSSILSAFGIFLADVNTRNTKFYNMAASQVDFNALQEDIASMVTKGTRYFEERAKKSNSSGNIKGVLSSKVTFVLKYESSEALINVMQETNGSKVSISMEKIVEEFKRKHKDSFGFLIETKQIILQSVYLDTKLQREDIEKVLRMKQEKESTGNDNKATMTVSIPFRNPKTGVLECMETEIFEEKNLQENFTTDGPALVVIKGSTIVLEPGWTLTLNEDLNYELISNCEEEGVTSGDGAELKKDPITLSIFGQRFMSIAEQMGRCLQRTSISTNIKERLDFSCAIFGPDGSLVANAPHLPVHLGSMEDTVRYQIEYFSNLNHEGEKTESSLRENLLRNLKPGDVLLTNHPAAGGSHLPDMTAISPCFHNGEIIFFVASRGHHSDIGGITPGSMPAFSQSIWDEGVAIKSFKIVREGIFEEDDLRKILEHPSSPESLELLGYTSNEQGCNPVIQGSRNVEDNVADLKAQVCSNNKGIDLLKGLVAEYSLKVVHGYMGFIQQAAEESVRAMLVGIYEREIQKQQGVAEDGECVVNQLDFMDDGSPINLTLRINKEGRSAVFDFEGTGMQVLGNFNTPRSVVKSAILYCLRALVDSDIPLNAGCLKPVEIILPENSLISPDETAAIVGGNVTTSQRITDIVLKVRKQA